MLLVGIEDKQERVVNITTLFEENRRKDALWGLCREPGGHGVGQSQEVAKTLFRAAVGLRLAGNPGDEKLSEMEEEDGWLGNIATGEIAAFGEYTEDKREASWFTDENLAKDWQSARHK